MQTNDAFERLLKWSRGTIPTVLFECIYHELINIGEPCPRGNVTYYKKGLISDYVHSYRRK